MFCKRKGSWAHLQAYYAGFVFCVLLYFFLLLYFFKQCHTFMFYLETNLSFFQSVKLKIPLYSFDLKEDKSMRSNFLLNNNYTDNYKTLFNK